MSEHLCMLAVLIVTSPAVRKYQLDSLGQLLGIARGKHLHACLDAWGMPKCLYAREWHPNLSLACGTNCKCQITDFGRMIVSHLASNNLFDMYSMYRNCIGTR